MIGYFRCTSVNLVWCGCSDSFLFLYPKGSRIPRLVRLRRPWRPAEPDRALISIHRLYSGIFPYSLSPPIFRNILVFFFKKRSPKKNIEYEEYRRMVERPKQHACSNATSMEHSNSFAYGAQDPDTQCIILRVHPNQRRHSRGYSGVLPPTFTTY